MKYYILNDKNEVIEIQDPACWARWIDTHNTSVRTYTNGTLGIQIDTSFLGVDHSFGQGPRQLFESMVFGGTMDQEQRRYANWEQAVRGHNKLVQVVEQAEIKAYKTKSKTELDQPMTPAQARQDLEPLIRLHESEYKRLSRAYTQNGDPDTHAAKTVARQTGHALNLMSRMLQGICVQLSTSDAQISCQIDSPGHSTAWTARLDEMAQTEYDGSAPIMEKQMAQIVAVMVRNQMLNLATRAEMAVQINRQRQIQMLRKRNN